MSDATLTTVVVDIEGTTSSTWFVHRTLYPYSRARFASWLAAHQHRRDVAAIVSSVRRRLAEPGTGTGPSPVDGTDVSEVGDPSSLDPVVAQLERWLDADEKVTELKAVQGWIWNDGFADGDLVAHFYDDVVGCLRDWHDAGLELAVFSSGSVAAQRAWFGHTPAGSLLELFGGRHFDTENTGPKKVADSYRQITTALGRDPTTIVFLSDLVGELAAAATAGWHPVGVRRVGDQYYDQGVGGHLAIHSFAELDLRGSAPRLR